MTNFSGHKIEKHEKHAAGGCGCGSHHAHGEAVDLAVPSDEGCCSGHGAKAGDQHLAVDSDSEHASHRAHGSCCGGHSATAPASRQSVRERAR